MTLKQDLAVILLSTGIGVFIGLGLGAQSDKRIVVSAPQPESKFSCLFAGVSGSLFEGPCK